MRFKDEAEYKNWELERARRVFVDEVNQTPDEGPESQLQKKIMEHCRKHGWPVFHDRSRRRNQPGWPDLFMFLPEGGVVLMELKAGNKKLRKEQKELRRVLNWLGHNVYIVRSFKRFLEVVECQKTKTITIST